MPSLGRLLERLTVAVDGDTSDADRKLRDFTDESRGGQWVRRLGGLAAKAGIALAAGAAAGTAALGAIGLKAAASSEQASIAFTSILGDAGKAKAFLADLNRFAAETPFDMPGLRDAASRLLAVGVQTESVIPLMRTLGDATSAMGTGAEGIGRAVTALTQMQVKGKVTGEEMLQLAEAGVPAWDALATVLGVSVAEAQEKVTKGQVKVADLFKAIETSAGPALGRVKGMMDAQSQSLTGLWSTLKDTFEQGVGAMMGPAVQAIKGLLPEVTTTLEQGLAAIGPQMTTLATGLVRIVADVLPAIAPLIGTAAEVIGTLFSSLAPAIAAAAPGIAALAQAIGGVLVQAFRILGPFLKPLGEVLGTLAGVLARVLQAAMPLLATFGTFVEKIVGALSPALGMITELFVRFVDVGLGLLSRTLEPMLPAIIRFADAFAGALAQAMVDLQPAFERLLPALVRLGEALVPLADTFGQVFAQTLIDLIPRMVDMFPGLTESLIALADSSIELIDALIPLIPALLPLIPPVAELLAHLTANQLAGMILFVTVLARLGETTLRIGELVIGFFRALPDVLSKAADWFKRTGDRISGFVDAVTEFPGRVVNAITRLPGQVVEILRGLPSALAEVGKDIVRGLWKGIQDMGQWLIDRVSGWVKNVIPGPMAKVLGIASPSREAMGIGRMVGLGLVEGLLSTKPLVDAAAGRLGHAAVPDFGGLSIGSLAVPGAAGSAFAGGGVTVVNRFVIAEREYSLEQLSQHLRGVVVEDATINAGGTFAGLGASL